jgi:hypothetical protein
MPERQRMSQFRYGLTWLLDAGWQVAARMSIEQATHAMHQGLLRLLGTR